MTKRDADAFAKLIKDLRAEADLKVRLYDHGSRSRLRNGGSTSLRGSSTVQS